ncbi:MAG: hypothetical protein WCX73_03835 [Candidatus Pacearchaeota archaeon]|jgi:hypothetical protein
MKQKIKNKEAQGHIEIILSFTLFVGFLLFIFIFLNPFAKTESKQIINNIQESIINKITGEIGKLSIIVTSTEDCYDSSKVLAYGDKFIEIVDSNNPRKYTIYYNDIFVSPSVPSCSSKSGRVFSLGTYSTEEIIIYEKIQELRTDYTNNYESLKTSLGILNDFMFELKRIDGGVEISVDKVIPKGEEVESVNIPMRVINSKGIISEYILNIRAW